MEYSLAYPNPQQPTHRASVRVVTEARCFLIALFPERISKMRSAEGFQGNSLGAFLGSFLSRDKNEHQKR